MKLAYFALLAALLAVGCSHAPSSGLSHAGLNQPEGTSEATHQPGWSGQRFAVATAHPLASKAGLEILQAGGSAVDAAIAAQMVLTLVEPQSSGIGGGAFLMHYDGRDIVAFDGRETAPASVSETLFMKADGTPMAFREAVVGGRAVGVQIDLAGSRAGAGGQALGERLGLFHFGDVEDWGEQLVELVGRSTPVVCRA